MKKQFIVSGILCLLLTGCQKEQPSVTSEVSENSLSLSAAGISTSQVESIASGALRSHCQLTKQECTLETVKQNGNDIYATYLITTDSEPLRGSMILKDIKVMKSDNQIANIADKIFETPVPTLPTPQPEQEPESEEPEITETLNLPVEEPESPSESGKEVRNTDTEKIYLMYLGTGEISFHVTYSGEQTFTIDAYPLDQKSFTQCVKQEGSGEADYTSTMAPGWYYIVMKSEDGSFRVSWAY